MTDVLIITVNYWAAEATSAFLRSVSHLLEFERAHVMVVENGSGDGSAERLRSLCAGSPNIELLESPTNLGYFGGASWALQQYLTKNSLPHWVIICNNDILFDDCGFLSKLLQKGQGQAAVIAPAIVARLTGVDCNPFMRRRPNAAQLFRIRLWHSSYYLMWIKQSLSPYVRRIRHQLSTRFTFARQREPYRIYGPHGAMLIFSRSYFEAGGYIDVGQFLFGEEICTAEICVRLGLQIVHDPELRVFHDAHQATGRHLSRAMHEHARRAFHYALSKYFQVKEGSEDRARAERRELRNGL